jgi:hypothetical protein
MLPLSWRPCIVLGNGVLPENSIVREHATSQPAGGNTSAAAEAISHLHPALAHSRAAGDRRSVRLDEGFQLDGRPGADAIPCSFNAAYAWPGNIRQLKNNIERFVILSPDAEVRPKHLPREMTHGRANPSGPSALRGSESLPGSHCRRLRKGAHRSAIPLAESLRRETDRDRPTQLRRSRDRGQRTASQAVPRCLLHSLPRVENAPVLEDGLP